MRDTEILERIEAYANQVLADIDPQKTPISLQLEKLRPIMEEVAKEKKLSVEDVFIQYMDLASESAVLREQELQDRLNP